MFFYETIRTQCSVLVRPHRDTSWCR